VTPREHIKQLTREYGIRIAGFVSLEQARASWMARVVYIPDPDADPRHYFTALHEIGHVVLEHSLRGAAGDVMVRQEEDAWRWAIEQALVEPDDVVTDDIRHALGSYGWRAPIQWERVFRAEEAMAA
jgi:hypothetical protein